MTTSSRLQPLVDAEALLKGAQHPEQVFGPVPEGVKERYRALAKATHSDQYRLKAEKARAEEAFKRLQDFYALAEQKLAAGTYGDLTAMTRQTIKTKGQVYTLNERLPAGDLANVYGGVNEAGEPLVFKVSRSVPGNALLTNESQCLRGFRENAALAKLKVMAHIPQLVDSFEMEQPGGKRRVNVLSRLSGFYTLAEVRKAHGALDLRDAAWMFNRLLGALVVAHQGQRVHGAVTLDHVMILPENHNGVLVDWSYSAKERGLLRSYAPAHKDCYPPEVFNKQPVGFGLDLYMASRVLQALVPDLPRQVAGLMRACQLGPKHRTQDVFELHAEFNEALKVLYGPRRFRKFEMP